MKATLGPRGDATRDALIAASMAVFGRDGFHAASLREIAAVAKVNQALIGYHYGGKEGLYLAVFESIVGQIRAQIGPLADAIERVMAAEVPKQRKAREALYLQPLLRLTDGFAALMAQERSGPWSRLILREQQEPTAAFQMIFESFMGPLLTMLTGLVQRLRQDTPESEARALVLTIVGQVLVFRAARAAVMRHMGWKRLGDVELAAIQAQVRRNVVALMA